jgi:protein-tyrosine phosphatase
MLYRSATIVISWLMYAEKMRFKQALQYVKERRHIVNPNIGFTQQL